MSKCLYRKSLLHVGDAFVKCATVSETTNDIIKVVR